MLFDTHLHLIYKTPLSYPWLNDYATLDQDNTLETYQKAAAKLGITGCFHMECDVVAAQIAREAEVIGEEAQKAPDFLRGIISSCRPEHDGFAGDIERAQDDPLIRGFRRVLHVVPDETGTTARFRDNIKRLSGTGLTYDLCVLPRQLPLAAALVDHCPDVHFILDHCGVPDIVSGALEPWRRDIQALAARPNVTAKISGIIAYAAEDKWTLDDLRPFFEETVAAFGHERLIWGSDSPVCNLGGGLAHWVAATHALTQGWSPQERDALYRLNAYNLWQL